MRKLNYPQNTSQYAERAASFREQMADFARGELLRELRETRHLSQEEAAHEIGVSVKTIRAWEKGSGIRWGNAKQIGQFYGVDPNSLVAREGINGKPADIPDPFSNPQLDRIESKLDKLLAAIGQPDFEGIEQAAAAAAQESAPAPRRASQASGTKPRKRAAS